MLAPSLSSILSVFLQRAFANCDKGVWIQSRPGGELFNANQYRPTTRTQKTLARELMFAAETAIMRGRNSQPI